MTSPDTATRRLAAIAVFDVVGYSRMMAEDEEATYAAFRAHRHALDPILLNHACRVVKETGDGVLVEVPSAVEAVQAAIEVQELMAERNAEAPKGRRMQLRIGINLGDVIVDEDGDVHGDGVNIAARLEGEAAPGGICISDAVHGQIDGRVEATFVDGGPVNVKNIPEPVHVWKTAAESPPMPASELGPSTYLATVAVLPFDEMSGEDEEGYFADGITEDLITALSRYPDFRVIARNSTFAYRDHTGDIRALARELDATHVVEGSVRRAGDRVRVTAQLIEAETGHHIWAERYDRELADVFEVQDEIVWETTAHIHPAIERVEGEKRTKRNPSDLDAWDLLLRSRWHYHMNTQAGCEEAIRLAELAAQRDPSFAPVHADLTWYLITAIFNRWLRGRETWETLFRHAETAYALDPNDGVSGVIASFRAGSTGFNEIEDLTRRAVGTAPYDARAWMVAGAAAYWVGEPERAIEPLTRAWQLGLHEPWRYHIATNMAFAHYFAERYEAAVAWVDRGLEVSDYLQLRAVGAAALGQMGRTDEARRHLALVTRDRPDQTASEFLRTNTFKNQRDVDHWKEGLVKAGMPE